MRSTSDLLLGVAAVLFLASLVFFIFQSGTVSGLKKAPGFAEPLLIVPSKQHLGKVDQFNSKNFTFTLRNKGSDALHILDVKFSCGCTKAELDVTTLAPGQSAVLTGSINAQNRIGEFGASISITYRTGESDIVRQKEVLVGGRAVTQVNLPDPIDWGAEFLGKKPEDLVFEIEKGESERTWDSLKLSSADFGTHVEKVSDGKWKVTLTRPVDGVVGRSSRDVELELYRSGVRIEQRSIPVFWSTKSENFSVSPSGIYLNTEKPVRIQISSFNKRPVTVSFPEPMDGVVIRENRLEDRLWLEVALSKHPRTGPAPAGKLNFFLSDGYVKEKARITLIQ